MARAPKQREQAMRPLMRLLPVRLAVAAALTIATPSWAQEEPVPFANEIAEYARRDAVQMPPPCGLLFVGSSSIRLWAGLDDAFAGKGSIQRGFGGSQTEHANRYFDRLVSPYRPSAIVLYEGENDLDAGKTPKQVEADIRIFLSLKDSALGSTPVYFISVKPSPARWPQFERQTALNERIRSLAVTRNDLVYVDVVGPMLGESGKPREDIFLGDRLHMNSKGYAIWNGRLAGALAKPPASRAPHCERTG